MKYTFKSKIYIQHYVIPETKQDYEMDSSHPDF